jgi:hypothetical protein
LEKDEGAGVGGRLGSKFGFGGAFCVRLVGFDMVGFVTDEGGGAVNTFPR